MIYYVVDANVMLTAGTRIAEIPDELLECWKKCQEFIHDLIRDRSVVVVDDAWEVLNEYVKNKKRILGYPNVSDDFFRYVMTNHSEHLSYVHLRKVSRFEFENYPDDAVLKEFDPPDRKYIALAYNHSQHPPVVEATDSKWWGIQKNLAANGIEIKFIDARYIEQKYSQKMREGQ